jgi:glycosyltransferase involved in cell wall biosynthesis
MKKISVIIPTMWSNINFLKEAIQSVLIQQQTALEIVVCFDNNHKKSSLSVENLIDSYNDNRIILRKNSTRAWSSATRNQAIDVSSWERVAFLDDDDIFHREKLSFQSKYMDRYRKNITGTQAVQVNGDNISWAICRPISHDSIQKNKYTLSPFNLSSVMIERKLLDDVW